MTELAVDLAKLAMAEAEIQKAVGIYHAAVEKAKAAGNALLENWVGEAARAFAEEQAIAYKWHLNIVDIITSFAQELNRTIEKYREYDEKVKALIQGS